MVDTTKCLLIKEMAEGNMGAIEAIVSILENGLEIDPDAVMGNIRPIMQLDKLGIKGTQIFILWSDQCKKDTRCLLMLLRSVELGHFKASRLQEIAGDQTGAKRLLQAELDALDDKVCADLPNFKRKAQVH